MGLLSENRGFHIWSWQSDLTFICRSAPSVRDASSIWIGFLYFLSENYWEEATSIPGSGPDKAMAVSWRNISIPSAEAVTRSIIIKFTDTVTAQIELKITFPSIESLRELSDVFAVSGTVTSTRPNDNVDLFSVRDGDYSTLTKRHDIPLGSFSFYTSLPIYGIYDVKHQLSFYAVNDYGEVSSPQTFYLSGVPIGEPEYSAAGRAVGPSMAVSYSDATAVAVGTMVGVTVGLLVVAIVGALLIRWFRKKKVGNAL
jgi:hypothetical protein